MLLSRTSREHKRSSPILFSIAARNKRPKQRTWPRSRAKNWSRKRNYQTVWNWWKIICRKVK
jgi:hypothetical protein